MTEEAEKPNSGSEHQIPVPTIYWEMQGKWVYMVKYYRKRGKCSHYRASYEVRYQHRQLELNPVIGPKSASPTSKGQNSKRQFGVRKGLLIEKTPEEDVRPNPQIYFKTILSSGFFDVKGKGNDRCFCKTQAKNQDSSND